MQDPIAHYQTDSWLLILFPLLFVALWCFVCAVVSYFGGWTTLSGRFQLDSDFAGDRWRFQTGQMRWQVNYGNCLTLGANPQGLYLAVLPLFRLRHPPLMIPWHEVISATRRRRFFVEWVRLELGREERIPLAIRAKLAERLRVAAGARWPVERRE